MVSEVSPERLVSQRPDINTTQDTNTSPPTLKLHVGFVRILIGCRVVCERVEEEELCAGCCCE